MDLQTQQTPKPDAQDPSDVPPLVEHSSLWQEIRVCNYAHQIFEKLSSSN